MAARPAPTISGILERCAARMHAVALDFAEPSRSTQRHDRLVDEVEQICEEARASVRGPGAAIDRLVVRRG